MESPMQTILAGSAAEGRRNRAASATLSIVPNRPEPRECNGTSADASQSELVAVSDRLTAGPVDFQQLLALDVVTLLVFQVGQRLFRPGIDHLSGGRIRI